MVAGDDANAGRLDNETNETMGEANIDNSDAANQLDPRLTNAGDPAANPDPWNGWVGADPDAEQPVVEDPTFLDPDVPSAVQPSAADGNKPEAEEALRARYVQPDMAEIGSLVEGAITKSLEQSLLPPPKLVDFEAASSLTVTDNGDQGSTFTGRGLIRSSKAVMQPGGHAAVIAWHSGGAPDFGVYEPGSENVSNLTLQSSTCDMNRTRQRTCMWSFQDGMLHTTPGLSASGRHAGHDYLAKHKPWRSAKVYVALDSTCRLMFKVEEDGDWLMATVAGHALRMDVTELHLCVCCNGSEVWVSNCMATGCSGPLN
jgi:hypothetical protein